MLFAHSVDDAGLQLIVDAFRTAPKDAVQIIVVLPQGTDLTSPLIVEGVELVVVDTLGHAADAYPPAAKGFPAIVVRPDGVVGAVARGEAGVMKYIQGIFVH